MFNIISNSLKSLFPRRIKEIDVDASVKNILLNSLNRFNVIDNCCSDEPALHIGIAHISNRGLLFDNFDGSFIGTTPEGEDIYIGEASIARCLIKLFGCIPVTGYLLFVQDTRDYSNFSAYSGGIDGIYNNIKEFVPYEFYKKLLQSGVPKSDLVFSTICNSTYVFDIIDCLPEKYKNRANEIAESLPDDPPYLPIFL